MARPFLLLVCVATLSLSLPMAGTSAQVASPQECGGTGGGVSRTTHKGPYEALEDEVVEIESEYDDGVIQIGMVKPDVPSGTRTPVIVDAGPYYWSDLNDTKLVSCNEFLVENFVQHGYTVAFVPTRGTGGTDRCSDLMGPGERAHLDEAITWLGEQQWSDGKVGMTGISYDGSTPWEVAAEGNPYLATIVPVSGVTDLYSQIYRSGRNDARWWLFVPGYQTVYSTGEANPTNGRDPVRWAEAAMCQEYVEGLGATAETYVTAEDDGFGYWAQRDSRPGTEKRYRGSVFVVHGMIDHNVPPFQSIPWVNKLKRKGTYVKMMLGQWGHAFPDTQGNAAGALRYDYADILLSWWDRWLKEKGGSTGARVEVQDASGRWRTEDAWPPTEDTERKLYLTPQEGMFSSPGDEEARKTLAPGARSRYLYVAETGQDPESPLDPYCATCAVFATEPQSEDLNISGIPSLDLTVVPNGPGGSVAAYLYRVGTDDVYDLIGYGNGDLRFPKGGHEASAVAPGEEKKFGLDLEPLDALVAKGERLVLVLEQGTTYDMPGPFEYPVDLVYGGKKSSFTFPTVTPDPGSYFTPPPAP